MHRPAPRFTLAFVVSLAASLAAAAPPAHAQEPAAGGTSPAPAKDAPEGAVKDALARFERDVKDANPKVRVDSVKALGRVVHPTVAAKLLEFAIDPDNEARLRTEAFTALGKQTTSVKTVGPKLSKFLADSAEENRKKKARGDYGVRIDPRTNKTDTESDEGKAALAAKRERGKLLAEAVRAMDTLGHRDKDSVEVMSEFLSDGNDDLVVLALGMFGKWQEWSVLRDLLDLFEYYPTEDKVNVGSSSVDTGSAGSGDQQAAKRNWMAKYGDPDRRRARPPVVRALKKALLDITGETIETPEALREFLRRPDVKRKVK